MEVSLETMYDEIKTLRREVELIRSALIPEEDISMHEFDWGFVSTVLSLIWEMRDERKRKPAKKVEVLNQAACIGMGRERTEQAINDLIT